MYKPRTQMDWSKHKLVHTHHSASNSDHEVDIFDFSIPGMKMHRVKLVNCGGFCTVTGDFGLWVISRSLMPSAGRYISDDYITGHTKGHTSTHVMVEDATREHIEQLKENLHGVSDIKTEAWIDYYDSCLEAICGGGHDFERQRHDIPDWDFTELMAQPVKRIHFWLQAIFDAHDAMVDITNTKAQKKQGI